MAVDSSVWRCRGSGSNNSNRRFSGFLIDRQFQLRFMNRIGGLLAFYIVAFMVVAVSSPMLFSLLGESTEDAPCRRRSASRS